MSDNLRLEALLRHINNVRERCCLLGHRLLDLKEDIGHQLIANGLIHDNSKFYGIEWLYLHDDVKQQDPNLFASAVLQHVSTNLHHPEAWGGIDNMPSVYVAEMVCDWASRSAEFGNDLFDWIKEEASKKFKFSLHGNVYKEIKKYAGLLLEKKFV